MPTRNAGTVKATSRPAIYRAIRSLNPGGRGERMEMRLAMMNFILGEIAERHYQAFNDKSRKMTDEFRRRWKPLSPVTIKKKGHDTIGVDSGHMKASFQPGYTTPDGFYIKGHPDQIAKATAYQVQFGTQAVEMRQGKARPKAHFFHGGTVNQPARKFWTPRELRRWVKAGIAKSIPEIKRMMGDRTPASWYARKWRG